MQLHLHAAVTELQRSLGVLGVWPPRKPRRSTASYCGSTTGATILGNVDEASPVVADATHVRNDDTVRTDRTDRLD